MGIHAPLVDLNSHFRILGLTRRSRSGAIHVQVLHHDINDPAKSSWGAISYMRSGDQAMQDVFVNSELLRVRSNLHSLLQESWRRKLVESVYETHYFIDAICIDQANFVEREAQVMLMPDIYKKAKAVVVWLGHPPAEERRDLGAISRGETPADWDASGRLPRPGDLDWDPLWNIAKSLLGEGMDPTGNFTQSHFANTH